MRIVIRFRKCALCVDAPDSDLKWIQCEFDPDSGPRVDTTIDCTVLRYHTYVCRSEYFDCV